MSTSAHLTAASLRVFLSHIVDYAGLFPPASLDMAASVNNYSRYLRDPQSWALGKFVLPASRLDEFMNIDLVNAHESEQQNAAAAPWQLAATLSSDVDSELAAVGALNDLNRMTRRAAIRAVEVRVQDVSDVVHIRKNLPPETAVFFEISPEQAEKFLPVLRKANSFAKLRTGGVVEEAFPAIERIAEFIARCAELGVGFKATAGLHHPVRCVRALTYEQNAREGLMHGFLNFFTASAIAWSAAGAHRPIPRPVLATCLADEQSTNWHFGEDALTWSGDEKPRRLDLECLRSTRSNFALSFGSCSFEEPLQDLHALDLL